MKRIAFFTIFFPSICLHAQQTDTTELLPVEVRATRASAIAPFAKTNISKAEIERMNLGQDLPFILNQTPSVVVNSDAGTGIGYTGIRIRGTDATRINVTLNGIPYNDAESQGTFFVNLPDFASSVNSIQVQRGVGTSTNGAGAFGASVNISTHEKNLKPYVETNNSYGSFNSLKNTIKAGTGLMGNHFLTDVRLSRITSDGYIDRASSDLKALYFSTAYVAAKSELRFNYFTGKEITYQAWNGISESDLKTSRTINYAGMERPGEPYDNETDNYRQNHYQLFFNHRLHSNLSFNTGLFFTKGKGFYEQYKADRDYGDYNLSPAPGQPATTDLVRQLWLDNKFYGSIFSLQHRTEQTELIFGGALSWYEGFHYGKVKWTQNEAVQLGPWYHNFGQKRDLNFYVKTQHLLSEGFYFFSDIQFRNVNYTLNGFRDNLNLFIEEDYGFVNPKLGLSYKHNNWLFFGSYSIGRKEPNRDDFEASVNDIPKPENLHDIEIGIENRNASRLFAASFYYMKYKDQLVLTGKINDVGAYTRTNIDDSYRVGVELQSAATINKWLRINANLNLSRNKVIDFNEYVDDYDNGGQVVYNYKKTDIAFSPDLTSAVTLNIFPAKGFSLDLLSKYVSRQYLDNTSNKNRSLDPYFVQDLRAIYSLPIKSVKADLIFQVYNLFDNMYEPNGYTFSYIAGGSLATENYYFPMAGRNFMAGINIRWN